MKVKIQQRSVYHKFAEVEIEIDKDDLEHFLIDNGKFTTIHDYLLEKSHLYDDQIDNKISTSEYLYGKGLDSYRGMDEDSNSEWRYECDELKIGGHL